MDRLYDCLNAYRKEDDYPFHMPGHKRNTEIGQMVNPYSIDITEIEGFDNLHQMEGILLKLSERLRSLYGSGKAFPLVNGSTGGILAGISAAAKDGSKALIARNCHKSVYHAVVLNRLKPLYLYPPYLEEEAVYGGVSADDIREAFHTNPDISLVVITSPTFDGFVSDIRKIAEIVHGNGALLLVDEAHGAHLGFHKEFPESAVTQGADIIIQSLHKTLPALTQTAVLHSNRPDLNRRIEQYLSIYESSSPSYLLLAGIDRCISLLEDRGKELFDSYDMKLNQFYTCVEQLKHLKVMKPGDKGLLGRETKDPSKIIISVRGTGLSGHMLHTLLRERYHLILEMEAPDYVLALTSICDTEEGFDRLFEALKEIDAEWKWVTTKEQHKIPSGIRPEQLLLPGETFNMRTERILLKDSGSRIAAAFVSMYPPGSPLVVPGERIEEGLIRYILWLQREGYTVTGLSGELSDEIDVISNTL